MDILGFEFLIAAVSTVVIGSLILKSWKKSNIESFFYWGFGLCIWGVSLLMEWALRVSLLTPSSIVLFVRYHLEGLAFVFFLLYGTLILLLKKSQSNMLTGIYYICFFVASIIIGTTVTGQIMYSVWYNVLFITPPALVLGVYYHYYYRNNKNKAVLVLSNLWILYAVLAFLYTFLFGTGLLHTNALAFWSMLHKTSIIFLSLTYLYFLIRENSGLSLVYRDDPLIIEAQLKEFFEKYFYDRADAIIKEEMEKTGVKNLLIASRLKRETFIDLCIKDYFSNVASLQKQEIIRTEMMSLLGLSRISYGSADREFSNARM